MQRKPRHILSASQFSDKSFLISFLEHVNARKNDYINYMRPQSLQGLGVINLFLEPSTRTRLSFSMAAQFLGAAVESVVSADHSSFSKGESYEDAMRVMSRYCDLIVMRSKDPQILKTAAEVSHVPIINAGDGGNEHPTQALLDIFTIYESFPNLNDLTIVFCGDLKYGRTVHSNIKLLNQFDNMRFIQAAPRDLQLPQEYIDMIRDAGNSVEVAPSLKEAAREADVVYMTRVQKERLADADDYQEKAMGVYRMTPEVMRLLPETGIVMHPLPRDSSAGISEIDPEVDADSRSKYFEQVRNGVPTRMALLEFCLYKFKPDMEWIV